MLENHAYSFHGFSATSGFNLIEFRASGFHFCLLLFGQLFHRLEINE